MKRISARRGSECLALTLMLGGSLAQAQPQASVEARLEALESRWDTMESNLAQLRQLIERRLPEPGPELAAIESVSGSVAELKQGLETLQSEVERQDQALGFERAARQSSLNLSTYGQINAIKVSGQNSLIDGESFELILSGQPHERISFFSELEFERAATVGGARAGEVLVEQAYVDYTLSPQLAFRAGIVLVPLGNLEADHYAPLRDVIARPLSSRLIAPADWTDNGFGLVGQQALGEDWRLNWEAYVIAGLGGEPDRYGLRSIRQGFGVDNNNQKALAGHLSLQRESLSVGLGAYRGAYDDAGKQQISGLGLDFLWYRSPWKFTGEYLRMRLQRENAQSAALDGGYVRVGYDLNTLFDPGWSGEAFIDPRLSLIYEYDYLRVDDFIDPSADAARERKHLLGLLFAPDHSWNLKLNREWSRASGPALINGTANAWLLGVGFVF